MRIFLAALLMICGLGAVSAQKAALEKNDPQATALLDKLRKKYDSASAKELSFSLVTEVAGSAKETQKGTFIQKGKAYFLDLGSNKMIADGKTSWFVQAKNKEVQINDQQQSLKDKDLTPENILNLYQRKDYIYAMSFSGVEGGRKISQIEFKPNSKTTDISKFRVTIDTEKNDIREIKVFNRDGSRLTLNVNSVVLNKTYPAAQFAFSEKNYPGYHIEDLRID